MARKRTRAKTQILLSLQGRHQSSPKRTKTMDDRAHNSHQIMESKTQFDLNRNLELWRQSLAESPSFQPDNLDELEVHIRDSVSTLEVKGLSTEEAFLIATRRLGQPTALDSEFGKVNSEAVWI